MLRFVLSNKRERQEFEHEGGVLEFGRGPERHLNPEDSSSPLVPRCIIQDLYVSKDHMRLEEQEDGTVRIENLSSRNSIRLHDNSNITPGDAGFVRPPARMMVGETLIQVELVADPVAEAPLETIAAPRSPKIIADSVMNKTPIAETESTMQTNEQVQAPSLLDLGEIPSADKLMNWFETLISVQQAAAGSPEFYQETARAVVNLVGLDRGLVILRAPRKAHAGASVQVPSSAIKERWMVQARYPDDDNYTGREFSMTILERVMNDRRTYFQSNAAAASTESLQGVEAVVASPIFDAKENVIGYVYGSRNKFSPQRGTMGIGPLEAQVMQLLASAVGVGLARQQQEAEASRARVQFEQFFSAELAQELQRNPELLKGTEREITVLFSDIRGFSRLSEKLGPQMTCELVADVMSRLTVRVMEHEGCVVDYAGDGLMAMWNAPMDQPDHAERGCRAALDMLKELPGLNEDWNHRLGAELRVGIGLNTGPAMCGNTGSNIKFKYGPLGHTVNLASRVESATKQMGVPLMITGSTRAHLNVPIAMRRLAKVQVVGIDEPVDFYELYPNQEWEDWENHSQAYEQALELFEHAEFGKACHHLYPLLEGQEGNYDIPSLLLVSRAVEFLRVPPAPDEFDGVLRFTKK